MEESKTRNLIILGNGFDLDLGLDTSFSTFVKSYEFRQLPRISFIQDMSANNWSDVEGCIRNSLMEYSRHPNATESERINHAWQTLERAWGRFLPSQIEQSKIEIKKDSCAFALLSNEQVQAEWYSFNYTHPRYLCRLEGDEPICIHNDCVEHDFANRNGLMYPVSKNLIIGVDTAVPENIREDTNLRHIIKKRNTQYQDVSIMDKMRECEVLVLFGHSMGITDSDYFRDFFSCCMSGLYHKKAIYIVTKDKDSLEGIKKNLQLYGVDYDRLVWSDNRIIPVYTAEGKDSQRFRSMLTTLSNQ